MATAKLLSVEETCEQLGIKVPTLRICQRRITYVKLGRRILFHPEDLERFVEENRVEAADINAR